MEIKTESTTKGTRILFGDSAENKMRLITKLELIAKANGFKRMILPILQFQSTFASKVGGENQKMMYSFEDAGGRPLCLAPEYTAVIQQLAQTTFKMQKDVKIFYVQECFRAEKPQAGRYRQFTQLGCEVLNPTRDYVDELASLANWMCTSVFPGPTDWHINKFMPNIELSKQVTRGLDYYVPDSGFEITYATLGAQKQICGGGAYQGGVGFAVGVDRLMLIEQERNEFKLIKQ